MQRYNILWADDEIDMLKPHILFLEGKGNTITAVGQEHKVVGTIAADVRGNIIFHPVA